MYYVYVHMYYVHLLDVDTKYHIMQIIQSGKVAHFLHIDWLIDL